ncbi:MAG: glutamate--tRNA ligase [Hyphomicrobiales bacterium]|nr:glutamate--tRNA ligase [Hyphomicrobiales bacterium]
MSETKVTSPAIVRFAPSPTGRIHIGNARTALFNQLFAWQFDGRFVLRFDDTDVERSREEFAASIVTDLAWLGIKPDVVVRQSQRVALYEAAAARLRAAGRLYPCYETPDELDRRRKRQQARGLPPVYDRAALHLTDADRAALEAEGRRPHWRFRLDPGDVTWEDLVRGHCHADAGSLSDPVLVREDDSFLYTLPSVVDDLDLGITHVIRGEDHVTNTAVQLQIFAALGDGRPAPRFAHHNLLTTASGEGLSKRSGALSLTSLREHGIEALAVAALAVLTGTSAAVHPVASLAELVALFDLGHVSRTSAKFDEAELEVLSARTLHILPLAAIEERLAALGITRAAAIDLDAFWLAVRGNLAQLADARLWWQVVTGPITPLVEDADLLAAASAALPQGPLDGTSWKTWTDSLKAATGRKGKALYHPLRLALTGHESGPDLAALLPLIGPQKAALRLAGKTG